jgi:nanoRNase/pAp phosphatase (c-di-AMP/oligoRNAs hydrolase)
MTYIDIFNCDGDGICALTQLHNAHPREAKLVTGVKRNIQLVDTVNFKAHDQITILDISLDKNIKGVRNALATEAQVFYVDHHYAGTTPKHKNLKTLINTSSNTCTSLLINQYLKDQFIDWAIVGAFGDNLITTANDLGKQSALFSEHQNYPYLKN